MTPAKAVLPIRELDSKARKEVLAQVCDWERIAYGEGKHRTPAQLELWLKQNDEGFLCCFMDGIFLAYADLWSIKQEEYKKLRAGLTLEEEIPPEALCRPSEFKPYLYVGSIITNPAFRKLHQNTTRVAFIKICAGVAELLYGYKTKYNYPFELLGVGSSNTGIKLLTHCNFKKFDMAADVIDTRPRYIKSIIEDKDIQDFIFNKH
jgi:hypothetical protein